MFDQYHKNQRQLNRNNVGNTFSAFQKFHKVLQLIYYFKLHKKLIKLSFFYHVNLPAIVIYVHDTKNTVGAFDFVSMSRNRN